jgi:uncharacterized protein
VSDGQRIVMTEQLLDALSLLAGEAVDLPTEPRAGAPAQTPSGVPDAWPAEALRLLERADERMRAGDWQGYGAALAELRALLEGLSSP